MNKYPEFIDLNNKRYKINTDFRLALKCNKISQDESICEYEKMLAIIYVLLGNVALNDDENYEEIFELLLKYLRCGKNIEFDEELEEPSMDFEQDEGYIKASFMSDYGIDLDKEEMSWYKFHDLLSGLTENSVLSRVRSIREEPLSDKKGKEREKWERMKKQVELKHKKTEKEKELDEFWEQQLKGGK